MSVLETPRLIFRGQVTWDPIVTNNSSRQYDEADAQTVFGPGGDVTSFRKAAIAAMIGRNQSGQEGISNWNPLTWRPIIRPPRPATSTPCSPS